MDSRAIFFRLGLCLTLALGALAAACGLESQPVTRGRPAKSASIRAATWAWLAIEWPPLFQAYQWRTTSWAAIDAVWQGPADRSPGIVVPDYLRRSKLERDRLQACYETARDCPSRAMARWALRVRDWRAQFAEQGPSLALVREISEFFVDFAGGGYAYRGEGLAAAHWSTLREFLAPNAPTRDCEDWALAAFETLRAVGFGPERRRVVIANRQAQGAAPVGHAFTAVLVSEGVYHMDIFKGRPPLYANDAFVGGDDGTQRYTPAYALSDSGVAIFAAEPTAWLTSLEGFIGGSCATNGDCGGFECDTSAPGGLCTMDCMTAENFSCPDPDNATRYVTFCADLGAGTARCLARCSPGSTCREGYACREMSRPRSQQRQHVCVPDDG